MSARAHERWAAFLKQIADRHKLVSDEAEQGARTALAECGYDPTPIASAWGAVTHRLQELERRIIDTWNEKVGDTFQAEGYPQATWDSERRKGEDLAFELENARQALEMRVLANGAREMFGRALATQKERLCPRCGAPLAIPFTHRAINVTCGHCQSVGTFEPGALLRTVVAFAEHPVSWEAAQQEWLAMRLAERRIRDTRSPAPLALLKDYERAQIAYWFRYIGTRVHFAPELRDVAHEVRSRMDAWYRMTAEHEQEWVRAGRPREVF